MRNTHSALFLRTMLLAAHPSAGWADTTGNPTTPLTLAFAAAEAEELELSEYRYRLDYESLAVKLDATVDPNADEGQRIDVRNSVLSEGVKPDRLDAVVAEMDRAAAATMGFSNFSSVKSASTGLPARYWIFD